MTLDTDIDLDRNHDLSAASDTEDGFTLVELLVVVVIVAILAGLAIPTFLQQRERAWESAVRAELRSAIVALESHRAELGGYGAAALSTSDWGYVTGDGVALTTISLSSSAFCLSAHYGDAEDPDPAIRLWVESGGAITDVACT
jgi:prepilin-type N-terminal cleavage/methylation domain-containing protein